MTIDDEIKMKNYNIIQKTLIIQKKIIEKHEKYQLQLMIISAKGDKCEYLMGEETLPSRQRR